MNEKIIETKRKNYKNELKHQKAAESRGNLKAFQSAQTITEMKKLAYGQKTKSYSGWKGHPDWVESFKGQAYGGRNK